MAACRGACTAVLPHFKKGTNDAPTDIAFAEGLIAAVGATVGDETVGALGSPRLCAGAEASAGAGTDAGVEVGACFSCICPSVTQELVGCSHRAHGRVPSCWLSAATAPSIPLKIAQVQRRKSALNQAIHAEPSKSYA